MRLGSLPSTTFSGWQALEPTGNPGGDGARKIASMDVTIFTASMRTEFLKSIQAAAEPAPFERFTQIVPSTARLENFAWMTPAPGIAEYHGHRRFGTIDQVKYTVVNREYDAALQVPLRDIEDDIVGGYKTRMNDISVKAKLFPGRLVLQTLAAGKTTTCFDGTNFFASTHVLGTAATAPTGFGGGGNALTFTSANSADGVVHRFALLIHNGALKPLLYQNRKGPKLITDSGTPQSEQNKIVKWTIDLEGAAAFGYWWDAILIEITNTPSLLDIFTCIDAAWKQILTFQMPLGLTTDKPEFIHEQLQLSPQVSTIVCSTGLYPLFRHALNEDRVGVSVAGSTAGITSNIYYRLTELVTSAFLN